MSAWILVAHIAVLGYWLGSELVINSTYRYVSYSGAMPFRERQRLMDHVMHVDQHVRYALVLQAMLGTMLAAAYGLVPGGVAAMAAAGVLGAGWLVFVEAVHRQRHSPRDMALAMIDRCLRYVLMTALLALAFGLIGRAWAMPLWLRLKLGLFAGVMACGVGIRFALIAHFRTWGEMARGGVTDARNRIIERIYVRATSILVLLWIFIAAIVAVSIFKPV